jgi:adenylyltransferase/sulfurtransferase
VSDACTVLDIPHVWAAVLTDGGQLSVFHASRGPVYRDLMPVLPPAGSVPSCAVAGVLGTVPGVLGTAMAGEVLKLVLGIGEPAIGRVLVYDMLSAEWESVPLARSPRVTRPVTEADVGADLPRQMSMRDLDPGSVAADGGLIIDVRTSAEAAAGMIPHARHLPLGRIEVDPQGALAQVRAWVEELAGAAEEPAGPGAAGTVDVYLHCKTGVRSARAQELLEGVLQMETQAAGGVASAGSAAGSREAATSSTPLRLIDLAGGYEAWVRDTGGDA